MMTPIISQKKKYTKGSLKMMYIILRMIDAIFRIKVDTLTFLIVNFLLINPNNEFIYNPPINSN